MTNSGALLNGRACRPEVIRWTPSMESPCIKICVLDEQLGICTGCGRTRAEIGGWTSYSEAQRRRIMADLPARLAATPATE